MAPDAARLAVVASVRRQDTRYDELLMAGVPRQQARERPGGHQLGLDPLAELLAGE